ncbi:protein CcdC [Paenibacillus sp. J31TS4]|uniref:CcdC family protein n=1 Tax=Paenibacillus sp. J31TS4 TaxID=2807195 RepID=UPI001B28D3CA|nr:cytochrome c biogenesis protein CcdC [Paenibacillus sp. J31TS4]GIP36776.1 protein CcdC [Paenibacillus sp. J31TS4]
MNIPLPHYLYTLLTVLFASSVIVVRLKAANRPVTARKLIAPPLGMSTGFLMFVAPITHIPVLWGLGAFLAGALLFSPPLIATSKFYTSGSQVYMKRSIAFAFILIGLLAVRTLLHGYLENYMTIPQTGALFFLLAFGMLLPWRVVMYWRYKQFSSKETAATP